MKAILHLFFLIFVVGVFAFLLTSCSDVDRTNPAGIDWEAELSSSSSEGTLENPSSSVDELSSVGQSSSSLGILPSSSGNSSSIVAAVSSSSNAIIYGATLIDIRDNSSYPTVVIGTQTWMAKNLNYKPTSGNAWCYNNDSISNCANYGRLYDWNAAMTACPTGWRLPSDSDWVALESFVGGSAGKGLKANNSLWTTNTGTDAYGFSALPGGVFEQVVNNFSSIRGMGYWWTATPNNLYVYARTMNSASAGLGRNTYSGAWGLSVRCVKGAASSSVVSSSSSVAQSSSSVVASSSSMSPSSSTVVASSSSVALSSSVTASSSSVVASSSSIAISSSTVVSSSISGSSSSASPVSSSVVASSSSVAATSSSSSISYGILTDIRDSKTYQTVVIGTQTWMAQNLNYTPATGTSKCYNDSITCNQYGRMYDYATAMTSCPTGWHLPDTTAWSVLESAVGGATVAGTMLKAKSGWNSSGNGTDNYGFSALPGGFYYGTTFGNVGNYGLWWTATPFGNNAYHRDMFNGNAIVTHSYDGKIYGFSVRCLKN